MFFQCQVHVLTVYKLSKVFFLLSNLKFFYDGPIIRVDKIFLIPLTLLDALRGTPLSSVEGGCSALPRERSFTSGCRWLAASCQSKGAIKPRLMVPDMISPILMAGWGSLTLAEEHALLISMVSSYLMDHIQTSHDGQIHDALYIRKLNVHQRNSDHKPL